MDTEAWSLSIRMLVASISTFILREFNVSFDEFSERIHSIFTDNCLTSTDYAIKFKNYNGRVAVHFSLHNEMVAGMTIYVQEQ